MNARNVLFILLGVFTIYYVATLVAGAKRVSAKAGAGSSKPTGKGLTIGFVTNFFDTLGIGSYATTTAMYRFWKMIVDEHIPGTLNVGHTLPVIAQAFIFTTIGPIESKTLIPLIISSIA